MSQSPPHLRTDIFGGGWLVIGGWFGTIHPPQTTIHRFFSHLGAADLVERLRINRGPRWYYQIGGNLTNQSASAELGYATTGDAPASGAETHRLATARRTTT